VEKPNLSVIIGELNRPNKVTESLMRSSDVQLRQSVIINRHHHSHNGRISSHISLTSCQWTATSRDTRPIPTRRVFVLYHANTSRLELARALQSQSESVRSSASFQKYCIGRRDSKQMLQDITPSVTAR